MQEFASYRMVIGGPQRSPLVMEPRVLLDWSNAERGTRFGATFLGTHEGRPAMIANGYGRGPWLRHEFHSLCTEPVVAGGDGREIHRFAPGIEWRELPGARRPPNLARCASRTCGGRPSGFASP